MAQVHQLRPAAPVIEPFGEYSVSDILRPPRPREWMVDATIMRRTVCLMTGAPGVGKSRLLQQLLSASALGKPWLGREVIPARTLGFFLEDDQDELERRQADINAHYDVLPADFEARYFWNTREGKTTELVVFEKFTDRPVFTDLWYQLWDFVREEGIQLVCLDPASAVFGGNINFARQVRTFVRACHQEALKYNGAVIINAHPNKADAGSYGGSIQWIAACRFAMSFRRSADYDEATDSPADARELWGLKANYVGRKSRDKLHWEHGIFVSDDPEPPATPGTEIDKLELDYRLLLGVRKVMSNGGLVPADVMAPGSMPKRARHAPDLARVPFNALYDAQERLLQKGQLVRVKVGGRCLIRPADGKPYEKGEQTWPL